MTSKNLFFNLMREDLKRRLWAVALTFLTFFFSLPVAVALTLSESRNMEESYQGMLHSARSVLGFNNGFIAVIIVLLSLILGVTSFSWLHSRKKVDFYHSLPVRREKLFFVNYLDGALILFFAYAVNLLLGLLVAMVNGIAPGDVIPAAFGASGFLFLHFVMLYSVTVLAMVLTGNILVGILGTGVLHLYFPALLLLLDALYQEFFKTSYHGGSRIAYRLLDKSSAFTLYVSNYSAFMNGTNGRSQILRIGAVILVTAAVTAVSVLLYRMRGSEAAGKAMAFKVSQHIIRIPVVILSALCGGLFFWYLHDSIGWAVFGLICGLLLSHCTIEIIYHFDFRKLFSSRISMAVCGLCAALVFFGFQFDLFGYDKYIPKPESLESVAVSLNNMEYWVDYGSAKLDDGSYYWDYESPSDYLFARMRITDTDTVLALVSDAVSQVEREKRHDNEWNSEYGNRYISFSVKYNLKNGREVYRSYSVYGNKEYDLVKKIYDSRDYRMAAYPVMEQTAENTGKIRVKQSSWTREVTRGGGSGETDYVDLMLSTYQEEMAALTSAVMERENPIAQIQFMTNDQVMAEKLKDQDTYAWRYNSGIDRGYYPVYPSFRKTIGLLKECGIELNDGIGTGEVVRADIDLYQLADDDSGRYYDKENVSQLTVTDQEELAALMETARLEDYANFNPFNEQENRIVFTAVIKDTSGQTSHEYSIRKADQPEFLKRESERFNKEVETVFD